jgi:mannose-6-phosphate isomerase-like protein (cupin superfamily)
VCGWADRRSRTARRAASHSHSICVTLAAASALSADETERSIRSISSILLTRRLDLATEIEGMAERQLRMRRITVEPGGQFALHDHRDRPGLFYIQDGTTTEYPEGAKVREHGAGQAVAVGLRTRYWEENRGTGRWS